MCLCTYSVHAVALQAWANSARSTGARGPSATTSARAPLSGQEWGSGPHQGVGPVCPPIQGLVFRIYGLGFKV